MDKNEESFNFLLYSSQKHPTMVKIGIFKPNTQNIQNIHIIQNTAGILTKFCTVSKTTNIYRGSSQIVPHKFKVADIHHLKSTWWSLSFCKIWLQSKQ